MFIGNFVKIIRFKNLKKHTCTHKEHCGLIPLFSFLEMEGRLKVASLFRSQVIKTYVRRGGRLLEKILELSASCSGHHFPPSPRPFYTLNGGVVEPLNRYGRGGEKENVHIYIHEREREREYICMFVCVQSHPCACPHF
jgi:hypothetical protein